MIWKFATILGFVLVVFTASLLARPPSGDLMSAQNEGRELITVTGSLVSRANGVDCPKIKTNDGTLVGISYISPTIPLGTQVVVSGYYAVVTECLGRVVVAQETTVL